MKIAPLTCMLLIFCCGCYGPRLGPTYTIDGIYTDGHNIELTLKRTWWHQILLPVDEPSLDECTTFVVTLPFPESDQNLSRLPTPQQIDKTTDFASYRPVYANSSWVRFLTSDSNGKEEISLIGKHRQGSKLLTAAGSPPNGTALSPSGRSLLVVKPDRATLLDLADHANALSSRIDDPLEDVLRLLIAKRRHSGTWLITDDLRYVVVWPSREVKNEFGDSVNDGQPMSVNLRGTAVDLQHQAIVYDRHNDQISTAPVDDGLDHLRGRMIDARSTPDGLQFLYRGQITDSNGTPINSIPPERRYPAYGTGSSLFASVVLIPNAWDPEHHRVVNVVVTKLGEYPNSKEPTGCGYAVEVADYGSQKVTAYTLDWTTIRDAINAAPPH